MEAEVFSRPAISRNGAYTEFIVIKESEVALRPKSFDPIHAAALPFAGLTAGRGWPYSGWRFSAAGHRVDEREGGRPTHRGQR